MTRVLAVLARSIVRSSQRGLAISSATNRIDANSTFSTSRSQDGGGRTRSRRRLSTARSGAVAPRSAALTSSDGVVGFPIDFDTASSVEGRESQVVTIRLEPDQVLRAESGAMLMMTSGVKMETTTGGGVSAGFRRMLTGQNLFISDYTYDGSSGPFGYVTLGTDFPSKIVRVNLQQYGGKILCQKGALLCASHTVDITMEFTKNFTGGFFGGEGFVLQGLTGTGDVMIKAGGALIRKDLGEGEVLRVSSGCLVGFQAGVEFGEFVVLFLLGTLP